MIELNGSQHLSHYPIEAKGPLVSRDDQQRLELALSKPDKQRLDKTEKATDADANVNLGYDAFYNEIFALDHRTSTQITTRLQQAFGSDKIEADNALWFAFYKARSEGQLELKNDLQKLVSVDFISRLKSSPPTTTEELKAQLIDINYLRREPVLLEALAQCKDDPDKNELTELINTELCNVIFVNGLVRQMMTHGIKPDLEF